MHQKQAADYVGHEVLKSGVSAFASPRAQAEVLLVKRNPFVHEKEARLLYVSDVSATPVPQIVDVPIDAKSAAQSPTPLAALYLLNRGPGFSIEQLGGIEASEAVFANTYRGHYVLAAGSEQAHWLSSVRLVRSSPVFRTSREWDFACLDDQCRRLLDHAAASVASIDADIGVAR